MKKQYLNLGEVLTKNEMKKITGGHDFLVMDGTCPPDAKAPPGCPCHPDYGCQYHGPIDPDWTPLQYMNRQGFCFSGVCQ